MWQVICIAGTLLMVVNSSQVSGVMDKDAVSPLSRFKSIQQLLGLDIPLEIFIHPREVKQSPTVSLHSNPSSNINQDTSSTENLSTKNVATPFRFQKYLSGIHESSFISMITTTSQETPTVEEFSHSEKRPEPNSLPNAEHATPPVSTEATVSNIQNNSNNNESNNNRKVIPDVDIDIEPVAKATSLLRSLTFSSNMESSLDASHSFIDLMSVTVSPTVEPSEAPSADPSSYSTSFTPTLTPSLSPTHTPTYTPSELPTELPSLVPSQLPTYFPSLVPSQLPTYFPSQEPSHTPTYTPSVTPTASPSDLPTVFPTFSPSLTPTFSPSDMPSRMPSRIPTVSPTAQPSHSRKPTLSPTAMGSSQSLQLTANQQLNGISANVFNANFDTYERVFVRSVYAVVNSTGVLQENIFVISVLDTIPASTRRNLLALQTVNTLANNNNSSSPSANVSYKISIPNTASVGFASAQIAGTQLQTLLTTSISSGGFTQLLQTFAMQEGYNATGLLNVTARGIIFNNVTIAAVVSPSDDDGTTKKAKQNAKLSLGGEIGVIVAAGVAGLGMLVVTIYVWLFAKPAKYGMQRKSTERTREIQIYI